MKPSPIVNSARVPRKSHFPFPRAAKKESGRGGCDGAKANARRPTEAFQWDGSMGNPQDTAAEAIRPDHEKASHEPLKDGSAGAPEQRNAATMEGQPGKKQTTEQSHGSFATVSAFKASPEWQEGCWTRWPKEESWPGVLDLYEAAARVRMSPDTLRRAAATGRDGKAKLAHQRFGTSYRFRTRDIDSYGLVTGR
jgi:hypothetical protein